MKKIFVFLMMALAACNISAKSNFVQVKDGHFIRDGKPYGAVLPILSTSSGRWVMTTPVILLKKHKV